MHQRNRKTYACFVFYITFGTPFGFEKKKSREPFLDEKQKAEQTTLYTKLFCVNAHDSFSSFSVIIGSKKKRYFRSEFIQTVNDQPIKEQRNENGYWFPICIYYVHLRVLG